MGGRDPVPLGRVVRSVQVCNIGFYILPPSFRSFWVGWFVLFSFFQLRSSFRSVLGIIIHFLVYVSVHV